MRTPLFDRLVDRDRSSQREPLRTLDGTGLRESVRRELEQLFNSRCPLASHRLQDRPRTVVEFGIPALSEYSASRVEDRQRLAEQLRRAIAAYEPRLAEVRVQLDPVPGYPFSLVGSITAFLVTNGVPAAVSFTTVFELKEGEARVHADP
jgi:type VI secretion system lysozyme-like protein